MYTDVLIVGSGHGGAQAAITLRQAGHAGSVTVVGRDPNPPYERPPLSKEYLAREKPFERILIRPETFWDERNIDFRRGVDVVAVDPEGHKAIGNDGLELEYGKMIWAAGGEARQLSCPGADLSGVHAVRHRADVDAIMSELDAGARRIVVIGGGYVGLEAAAALSKLGCSIVLLEALPRVLARVAGREISEFYQSYHREKGVDLRLNAKVSALLGKSGRVEAVRLESGEEIACEMVIVGIGISPSVAPLVAAGANGTDGVTVDQYCRTSLDDIYAVGDCAAQASKWTHGRLLRIESVQNANEMATTAAQHIMGIARSQSPIPWFWSNQFDLKLQTAGLALDYDDVIVRGDMSENKFSVIYLMNGEMVAIDSVNSIKDFIQVRKAIEASNSGRG